MNPDNTPQSTSTNHSLWQRICQGYEYCTEGVWADMRDVWHVKLLKTLNLFVTVWLNRSIQRDACALSFRTILAIVPILAILFAIGRGFGFQTILTSELFKYFPAQQQALSVAMQYVDAYLSQSSEGLFIGIGILLLLWTLISLMSEVEHTFNELLGHSSHRSLYRQITDYSTVILFIPILMICSAGISLFVRSALGKLVDLHVVSPLLYHTLDFLPIVLLWIIFTLSYILIPNTKVQPLHAIVAGVICGTAFNGLQWLFISGQIYVSKYNAIYGSFAFVPLAFIWLQLSWLLTLSGVILTYAMQNFATYNIRIKAGTISTENLNDLSILVLTEVTAKFHDLAAPPTAQDLSHEISLPPVLTANILNRLHRAHLVSEVVTEQGNIGYQPAYVVKLLTVGRALQAMNSVGETWQASQVADRYNQVLETLQRYKDAQIEHDIPIVELIKSIK